MIDDLIDRLARDLEPTRPGAVGGRLAAATVLGAVAALAGVLALLGPRPDMATAVTSVMFWMKLGYTAAIGVVGVLSVERIARPTGDPGRRMGWLAAPIVMIAVAMVVQIDRAPSGGIRTLVTGSSASICPWLIAATSVPPFVALMWAVRSLAPTRLRLAGAVTGLAAGGVAAAVYCLHCAEYGAPFVAVWYSLGMLAPCAVGALTGPRLLRW